MKAVKYILLGLAPLVLIVGLWMSLSGGGDGKAKISSSVTLVDVVTGELVTLNRSNLVMIPAPNKRDGKRTLYGVREDESGALVIDDRLRDGLRELAKTEKVVVDLKTFVVQPQGK